MRKVLTLLVIFLSVGLLGGSSDPRSAIPTVTQDSFKGNGIFGEYSIYNENVIDLINMIEHRFDIFYSTELIFVDLMLCNVSKLPIEKALKCLSNKIKQEQIYSMDSGYWSEGSMTGQEVVDAFTNRLKEFETRIYALENP